MKGKGSPVAPKEALVGKGDLGEALQDDPNEPIEINLAALADRIFLTDFGREFLDEFDLYGERGDVWRGPGGCNGSMRLRAHHTKDL